MIAEPDVALTDFALAAEGVLLGGLIYTGVRGGPARWWWTAFFWSVAAAALLGGVSHGFFPAPYGPGGRLLWRLTLLALGAATLAAWGAGAHALGSPAVARGVAASASVLFAAYALIVLFVADSFLVAVVHYAPAALFLLAALILVWRRTRSRDALAGVLGLVTLLAGSIVQWRGIAVHPVFFTHNALYHAIEMVALVLLYRAARSLVRPEGKGEPSQGSPRLTGKGEPSQGSPRSIGKGEPSQGSPRIESMLTRRGFLLGAGALSGLSGGCARPLVDDRPVVVNDIHSRLNPTTVRGVTAPTRHEALPALVRRARDQGVPLSIAAGRHAMGGQQFGAGTVLIDTRRMNRVLDFDAERGLLTVEAGIQWPELIQHLLRVQAGRPRPWGIVQKQTGADRLSIGGAIGANIHGRGLRFPPFVADLDSFTLVDAAGEVRRCSRSENAELFRLAVGGYGLLGVVATATLRLAPRRKIERVVEVIDMEGLTEAFERRLAQGFLYGDCQYATDAASPDLLRRGVFACYRPVDDATPVREGQRELAGEDWDRLLYLSHADKKRAFEAYAGYYLGTSGQIYWSDTHQLSVYVDDYHAALDRRLGATEPATEMITEVYVPRAAIGRFLEDVRRAVRAERMELIYGTIRLIERDTESVLAWAREPWACIIFNLHVVHSPAGLARAAEHFRRLIDLALAQGGSYFLTYHRWATRAQVERCHPRFVEFLRAKRRYDPGERFQSDWYRHYRAMFADAL